ncbi:MAG: MGMT family protein [Candidatus Methanofastidiosia archaeon]|jgi:O-6-methylguanine DNA methyltransferase
MELGYAPGEYPSWVIMEEKIYQILFAPPEGAFQKTDKANTIAQKVKTWIEYGTPFWHPFVMQGTPFQQKVYTTIKDIPVGTVTTYRTVAHTLHTKAYRAVGQALHANPVPLLVPCHRVIGSDRTLTGFGGGLDLKKKILEAEGVKFEGEKVKKEHISEVL